MRTLPVRFPYYLYDAPRMPAVVNAYNTLDDMQAAVLDCVLGDRPWNRNSPVNPLCGLGDAHF
jgi:beta-N-acetylhexosaminidase